MKNRSIKTLLTALAVSMVMIATLAACGSSQGASEQSDQVDMDQLMEQVAASEVTKSYEEYLKDEAFANCELFGIEENKAYVYLNTAEYVELKGKAYEMSGSAGVAIIEFENGDDGVTLKKVEWSADGSEHEKWIEENVPESFLSDVQGYDAYDEDGNMIVAKDLIAKVEEKMGVPVETENLLMIDLDKGTYEIVKTIETGSPENDDYKFDTETVEKGELKAIK